MSCSVTMHSCRRSRTSQRIHWCHQVRVSLHGKSTARARIHCSPRSSPFGDRTGGLGSAASTASSRHSWGGPWKVVVTWMTGSFANGTRRPHLIRRTYSSPRTRRGGCVRRLHCETRSISSMFQAWRAGHANRLLPSEHRSLVPDPKGVTKSASLEACSRVCMCASAPA